MARYGGSGSHTSRPFYVSLAFSVAVLMFVQFYASMNSDNIMRNYYALGKGGLELFKNPYERIPSGGTSEEPPVSLPHRPAPPVRIVDNAETRCLAQDWIKRHTKLQEDILSGARPPRYLVLQPECGYCGMCNRLNSILGSYLMAVLLDRAFIIDWKLAGKSFDRNVDSKYLQPRVVNWEASAATGGKEAFEWDDSKKRVFKGWGDDDKLRETLQTSDFSEFEPWEAVLIYWVGESPAIALRKNPLAKKLAVAKGLMREDTVWDEAWDEEFKKCALRALFQPTPKLTQAYCRVLHGQPARGIGIHVRTGDDRTWNVDHASPVDEHFRFARCADGIRTAVLAANASGALTLPLPETRGPTSGPLSPPSLGRQLDVDKWHVASDFQKVVDDVAQRYPSRVASLDDLSELEDKSPVRRHSANTPDEQFTLGPLLDLLLISSGMAVVGTCRSTFSASASYFGMLPAELAIMKRTNFEMRYFHSATCPEMPEDADSMCAALIQRHLPLVQQVLDTPPFITCPHQDLQEAQGSGTLTKEA